MDYFSIIIWDTFRLLYTVNGPYGTFDLYIRSNNIFTVVEVYVE